MTTFDQLRVGDSARVLNYGAMSKTYRARLLSMGLTRHATFKVLRVAPLGCPVEIFLRGSRISLRKLEASDLECEPL